MAEKITLDGEELEFSKLSLGAQVLVRQVDRVQQEIDHRSKMREVLLKARAAYLIDLRAEVVKLKSGVDILRLLGDI